MPQNWLVKWVKTQQLMQKLFNWGTIGAADDKLKLQQKTIWYWTDTTKQTKTQEKYLDLFL